MQPHEITAMTKKLDQKLSVAQLVPTVVSVSLVAIE
jgi:hypothetical protein